jgi:transcriptional regulator with XRE-family HTH domain
LTGDKLAAVRKHMRWSQYEMAEYFGVDVKTIDRWEARGAREIVTLCDLQERALRRLASKLEAPNVQPDGLLRNNR